MPEPTEATIRPTDAGAREMARTILAETRHGALGTLHLLQPDNQTVPLVTRVAVAPGESGLPMLLISALSLHAKALRSNPAMSLLLGDAGPNGDPLSQPRLSVVGHARFLDASSRPMLRTRWLQFHPKALVYVDLPDFAFVTLDPQEAFLNGGFGRAYRLAAIDLT